VDGGVGRYEFDTHRIGDKRGFSTAVDLFAALKGKGIYRTRWFRRHGLFSGCTDRSYRKTLSELNDVREQPQSTSLRTLNNAAEHEAACVTRHLKQRADDVLGNPSFDQEGRPLFSVTSPLQPQALLPCDIVKSALQQCAADIGVDVLELEQNPVAYEQPNRTPEIAVDDVGVKKQKPHRQPHAKSDKERKRAWTTVADVRCGSARYTLTGDGVPTVLRLTSALLTESHMHEANLLFFTDGQRTLKDSIFDFWGVRGGIRLILDWYHLQHKCRELGSLGLCGSIAAKKVHIEQLCRLLWYGLVDRAQAYIDALPPEAVRKPEVLETVKGYLERNRSHIPCYAARKRLGLRCSSNTVEKENDIVVATRQKHNGMGWSEDGSHALATLAAVRRNGEAELWLSEGWLEFTLAKAA